MPNLTIIRHDFCVRISAQQQDTIELAVLWGGKRETRRLTAVDLILALVEGGEGMQRLFAQLNVEKELSAYRSATPAADSTNLRRVTLQIEDVRLAAPDWEDSFCKAAHISVSDLPLVRVSRAPPRVAQVPFTLPLRFLQLGSSEIDVAIVVTEVFGRPDPAKLEHTVRFHAADPWSFTNFALPPDWRNADVLHLASSVMQPSSDLLMSTGQPHLVGTLGWLARATDVWRTRLVILEAKDAASSKSARAMAAVLVARGGPAVLVGPAQDATTFYRAFYDALIHDSPLDQALERAIRSAPNSKGVSLFGGNGREELIRVSDPGQKLNDLAEALTAGSDDQRAQAAAALWSSLSSGGVSLTTATRRFEGTIRALDQLRSEWTFLQFNLHESEGFIPLGRLLEGVRDAALAPEAASPAPVIVPESTLEARFVNPALWRGAENVPLQFVDPRGARLASGEPLVLRIQIGPRDTTVTVVEACALIEEPFKWQQGDEGVWLPIGLSGIDFDILGEPVQELWLPRRGTTDFVEFSIVPRNAGASFLRFCIYYGADLLQSYRLVAMIGDAEPSERRRALALLLDASEDRIGDATYIARLEYAVTAELSAAPVRDGVALSLFANDVKGLRVVTARSAENFSVSIDNAVAEISERIRGLLNEASTRRVGTLKLYAFNQGPDGYEGSWDHVDRSLRGLAAPGWELFCAIIDKDNRSKLQAELHKSGGVIQVGHALLENNLPWALIYDREYDPDQRRTDGLPAMHTTCRAGLDKADSIGLPPTCGTHPDCPLSPARLQEQRVRGGPLASTRTIVCPRHFWGYRHIIELPPAQVDAGKDPTPSYPRHVLAQDPAGIVVGYNAKLPLADAHIARLRNRLVGHQIRSTIRLDTTDRDILLTKGLSPPDVDLVYLFCHARGGRADPKIAPPRLELQGVSDSDPGLIGATALAQFQWTHAPLVFFNGCNTAVFSPDALSPFITAVVRDSKASGAIGTEIPVFQELAEEFATLFLIRFLDKEPAGAALLEARLEMLRRLNPMGIVYTLYAFSELSILQD